MIDTPLCEYCNAELQAEGDLCPRCSLPPMAAQEKRWKQRLPVLMKLTLYASLTTGVIGLMTMLFHWKDGLIVLSSIALQVWIYRYYRRRLADAEATLPGPATVLPNQALDSRKAYDASALVFVAMPAVFAVAMLAKHALPLVQ